MKIFGKNWFILVLIIGSILLFIGCGKSEEVAKPVEQVLHVESIFGKVAILADDNEKIEVRVGMKLSQGTVIVTEDKDSRCMLRTPAGSMIKLGGESKLVLAKLYKNNKLNTEKTGLALLAGKVLVKANKLAGNDEFSIKTKTAVAGVRGTQFIVEYYGDKGITKVIVKEGKVAVAQKLAVKMPKALDDMSDDVSKQVSEYSTRMVTASQTIKISQKDNNELSKKCEKIIKASVSNLKNNRSSVKALLKVKLEKLVKKEFASSDVPKAKKMTKKEKAKYEKQDFKDLDNMYKKAIVVAKKIAQAKQKLEMQKRAELAKKQAKLAKKRAKLDRERRIKIAKQLAKDRATLKLARQKAMAKQATIDKKNAAEAAKIADLAKRKAFIVAKATARRIAMEQRRLALEKKINAAKIARQKRIDKENAKYKKNTSADLD